MDSAINARLTLGELKASAPRSFDKVLIDLLVAIQDGQRPIVETPVARSIVMPAARFDDAMLRDAIAVVADKIAARDGRIDATDRRVDQLVQCYRQLEADYAQIVKHLTEHTHETIREVAA